MGIDRVPAGVYHILEVIGSISRRGITAIGGVMRFKEADFRVGGDLPISRRQGDRRLCNPLKLMDTNLLGA